MLRFFLGATLLMLCPAGPAFAHATQKSVSITDGATLRAAPQNIVIAFEHAARFGSVQVHTATGERIPVDYAPPSAPMTTFTIPLPTLAPDGYRITWRVIAEDGHVMTGGVSFTVGAK